MRTTRALSAAALLVALAGCAPDRTPVRHIVALPPTTTAATTTAVPPTTTTTPAPPRPATTPHAARSATTPPPPTTVAPAPVQSAHGTESGIASWYQTFDGTCAHKSIPKRTILTVTNVETGASVTCRVADRGPYVVGRIVDLDRELFAALARTSRGTIPVRITW